MTCINFDISDYQKIYQYFQAVRVAASKWLLLFARLLGLMKVDDLRSRRSGSFLLFEQFFPGHTSSVDIGTGVGCRRPLRRRRNDYVKEVWLLLFVYLYAPVYVCMYYPKGLPRKRSGVDIDV